MKKNNVLIAVLAVVLAAICAAVAFIAINQNKEPTKSETSASSTASLAGSVFKTTSKTTEKTTKKTTTKKETTTEDKYPFIRNGVWYLADIDEETCLAIDFKKNGKADIAFFNSDNIEGFDAQYFKGDAKYTIGKNKIVFSKLPEATGYKKLELSIKKEKLYFSGKKLKNYKKISLDNALKCFE
ncbi:MAG: hypothetical protein IKN26_01035 [Eubacterium sp.]|nr:hypothetical protein [Eubacterium sp.]